MTSVVTSSAARSLTTAATSSFLNTFPGTDIPSTLASSQSAVPTIQRPLGCGGGIQTPPTVQPVCALQANNLTLELLSECCNGAPRVIYASNCNVYCQARNQTLEQLRDCLVRNSSMGMSPGIFLCNRASASYTSLLPEATDPVLFTRTALPSTGTTGSTGAVTGGVSSTSSAAAGSGNAAPFRREGEFLSFAAWGTIAVLAMSGFASLMI